jgi:uncharacterized coiled-coil protein SlyX
MSKRWSSGAVARPAGKAAAAAAVAAAVEEGGSSPGDDGESDFGYEYGSDEEPGCHDVRCANDKLAAAEAAAEQHQKSAAAAEKDRDEWQAKWVSVTQEMGAELLRSDATAGRLYARLADLESEVSTHTSTIGNLQQQILSCDDSSVANARMNDLLQENVEQRLDMSSQAAVIKDLEGRVAVHERSVANYQSRLDAMALDMKKAKDNTAEHQMKLIGAHLQELQKKEADLVRAGSKCRQLERDVVVRDDAIAQNVETISAQTRELVANHQTLLAKDRLIADKEKQRVCLSDIIDTQAAQIAALPADAASLSRLDALETYNNELKQRVCENDETTAQFRATTTNLQLKHGLELQKSASLASTLAQVHDTLGFRLNDIARLRVANTTKDEEMVRLEKSNRGLKNFLGVKDSQLAAKDRLAVGEKNKLSAALANLDAKDVHLSASRKAVLDLDKRLRQVDAPRGYGEYF